MNILKLVVIILVLAGCKSYYMTTESLKVQLSKIDPKLIKESDDALGIPVPAPGVGSDQIGVPIVTGDHIYNGLTEVRCTDSERTERIFSVNYLTAVKLTEKSGRKQTVLFNTMFLKNNLIYASKSHLIDAPIKPLNINDVVKVELKVSGSPKRKIKK